MDVRDNIWMGPTRERRCMSCGVKDYYVWSIGLENTTRIELCDVCLSEIDRHRKMLLPKTYPERVRESIVKAHEPRPLVVGECAECWGISRHEPSCSKHISNKIF